METPSSRSFPNRVLITVGIVAASLMVLYLFVVLSRVLLVVFAGVLTAVLLGGGAQGLCRRTPLGRPAALAVVIALVAAAIDRAHLRPPPSARSCASKQRFTACTRWPSG